MLIGILIGAVLCPLAVVALSVAVNADEQYKFRRRNRF